MPSAAVNAFCEDSAGYLWIGTNEGVARTDGTHFFTLGRSEGLPDDDITAISCTGSGTIWFGCRNGALFTVDGEKPTVIANADTSRAVIQDIVQDRNGNLWIASADAGIWHIRDRIMQKHAAPGLPIARINAMTMSDGGHLICGTDSGLFVLEGPAWRKIEFTGYPQEPVISLFADQKGVLLGTANGYIELDSSLGELEPNERFTGIFPITLPDVRILAILRARNGDIWLGTPSGLIHLSQRGGQPQMRTIRESNGLAHDLVRVLHQDRSGAIWCGTAFGGMSRFMSDAFMHFTERDGLRSKIVSAVHRTPDGLLWIATLGGGVAVWNGHELVNHGRTDGLTDPYITTLSEDHNGFLLAGTGTQGIFRWNGRGFEKDYALSPAFGRVQVISHGDQKAIWVGHTQGLQLTDSAGNSTSFPIRSGVFDIAHTKDTMWIATGDGLYFMARDGSNALKRNRHLPPYTMYSLAIDGQNNLWIGTDGNGLLRWNGSELDSLTTSHNTLGSGELVSNAVMSVLLDVHENIWLGTRRGIQQIELDVMQEMVLDIQHFGAEDGFIGIEAFRNASMLDTDSTLWFGTLQGATRYDPGAERVLYDEPKVHLTSLQLFFENVDWSRWSEGSTSNGIPIALQLPYNRNHLTFNFTGISLAYPERVRYRYILEGHDPDWSPITTTDRVIYSNIPPGDYTFKIMARNASGIWTEEPLRYSFSIVAPFWQRTWLQALTLLFIAAVVFFVIRYRERRAKFIQHRLEGMVKDRTKELVQEQQRSEDLLLNILPRSTAEELKKKGSAETRLYDNCTVLFSDFTGFTSLSSNMDGHTLVADLDHFFRLFDRITDRFGIEKIKTIGDAYMCASGIPEPKPTHALDAVLTAFGMMEGMRSSNLQRIVNGQKEWTLRVGIHSGPIVAGVVGEKKFAYDIWGNTVNVASRMESNSVPGQINISGVTYAQVMDFIEVQPRGPIKVRGKGELQMYFALRLKPVFSSDQAGLVPNERLLSIREEMLSVMMT